MSSSTKKRAHFKSNLFSSDFGAGLLIAPNTIDFQLLFDEFVPRLTAVGHILAFLIIMICLFILGVIFARRADKSDLVKVWFN